MPRLGIRRAVAFLFLVLLSPAARAGSTDPALKWKTVATDHFKITYYEGEEEIARKLTTIVEDVYQTLSKKFDARPWGKTEVVVVDSHDVANGFTLVIPYNAILLRAVPAVPDSSLGDYDDWLRGLFVHEYTHVIHLTDTQYPAKALKFFVGKLMAPNGLTPGWVTEGLATYFETAETTRGRGRASFTDMLLRADIYRGKFLEIDQMAGTQYEWPSWQAQYLYGVGFWSYLAETYGEDKLIDFSRKYGSTLRFFMLNSQAKRVWKRERTADEQKLCDEDQWEDQGTYRTKKTYPQTCGGLGKTFPALWREWKASLERKYEEVKEKVSARGLNEGDAQLVPAEGESFSLPTYSQDGKKLAYLASSLHHPLELRLRDVETGKERVLLKKRDVQQMSFSPDGKKLIYSQTASFKRYNQFNDLFEVDLETGKLKQITKGKRARDPDYATDGGRVVAAVQKTGGMELVVIDPATGTSKTVREADQFDHPRWMPDGRFVVVSVHEGGQRDLWMLDAEDGSGHKITNDSFLDDRPAIDRERREIYFTSDRTGIPNVYRYDPYSKTTSQVSNVLTGAFAPSVGPDGQLAFQYYTGKGFEIRKLARARSVGANLVFAPREGDHEDRPYEKGNDQDAPPLNAKKYSPFPKLLIPRYLLPNASFVDGSVFLSAALSNFDPLQRHYWFGDITYRSDNNFVGYDFGYTYSRYRPSLSVGVSDYSVNYGDVFRLGTDFFEHRRRGYGSVYLPMGFHSLTAQYFFEHRGEQSGLPPGTTIPTLGRYSGFYFRYGYGKTSATAAAISPEKGDRFNINLEVTNHVFGSSQSLEQEVVWADARKYIQMPYAKHHVIALRAAGGVAFGDQLLQGNFGLGGSLGESPFSASSTRLFTLRGLPLVAFSTDRAWVASVEYRMPLLRVQRGIGTLPLSLNSAHFALFADIGDAFNKGNPSFRPMLGVGAELRADFIVGYHIPMMGRLGYGVILTHRERIAGLQDSLTGADARNGVVILELGTSF